MPSRAHSSVREESNAERQECGHIERDADAVPGEPALTRPIRWDLVEQNYDQMIKCATAIRQGTASTEAIVRRFTRSASHPTYQAVREVGRAQRTIFVARFLRRRELQREITEGLNIVEAFNGANSVIYHGKGGEIASNRHDEQEMTVLCLRILQAALVYVNTLLLQDVLGEDEWSDALSAEDRRGLTPLFWQHVLPYGEGETRHDRPAEHPHTGAGLWVKVGSPSIRPRTKAGQSQPGHRRSRPVWPGSAARASWPTWATRPRPRCCPACLSALSVRPLRRWCAGR